MRFVFYSQKFKHFLERDNQNLKKRRKIKYFDKIDDNRKIL